MKIVTKILIILALLLSICGGLAYDSFYVAPGRITVRYETLSSTRIGAQLNDVNILFFSDLQYNTFMNESRLNKLVALINELAPDVIVFGGDLFNNPVENPPSQEVIDLVTTSLQSLKAPLGKFAVLGDHDHYSQAVTEMVEQVLHNADFEMITNTSVKIRNHGSAAINLVGIDSGLYGNPMVDAAYANVSRQLYTIAVCHTPDTAIHVPTDITDYFLSGHSLGGQAFYLFGSLYEPQMAEIYRRGKNEVYDAFTLDITNGIGTVEKDIRFLSNAEVVMYRLKNKPIVFSQ